MTDTFINHQPHHVYTRASWADAWEEQPYLYANRVRWACNPTLDEAELEYSTGSILRPDKDEFEDFPYLEVVNHFVKVEIEQDAGDPKLWHGVIVERTKDLKGSNGEIPNGRSIYLALGLEYLLDLAPINQSVILKDDGSEETVNRAIGFNSAVRDEYDGDARAGQGTTRQGNMSSTLGANGAPIFRKPSEAGELWSVADMLDHLLRNFPPKDATGTANLPFQIDGDSFAEHLFWATPVVKITRQTILDVLNQTIDRRRLAGWRVTVGASDELLIEAFTFSTTAIDLPDGSTIPANTNTVAWDFDGTVEVASAVLVEDYSGTYDRVRVRGERRGSVFTISTYLGKLEKDWTTDLQTDYNAGSGAVGDRYIKQDKNRQYRASDKFRRVYQWFRLDDAWNGKDGAGTVVCPSLADDTLGEVEPFWYPGLRFKHRLPLKKDVDYSGSKIADGATVDSSPAGSLPEFLEPIVIIKTANSRYRHIEKLAISNETEADDEGGGFGWSASVRMQDEAPGIALTVHGAPQHVLAKGTFSAADADDAADWTDSGAQLLNCFDDIQATVFCEFDSYCEGLWPTDGVPVGVTNADSVKELLIEVNNARLDYVVPGTVVALTAAGAVTTSTGGYLTDDRQWLENIARVAYEWYCVPRYALDVTLRTLIHDYDIGQLITNIQHGTLSTAVNSVITEITMDLLAGTTTIKTKFAELDLGIL